MRRRLCYRRLECGRFLSAFLEAPDPLARIGCFTFRGIPGLFMPCGHTANPHGHRATLRNCPFILGHHRHSRSAMQLLGGRKLVLFRQSVLSCEIPFDQQTRSAVASETAAIKDKVLPKSLIKNTSSAFRTTPLTSHYGRFPFPGRGLQRTDIPEPRLLRKIHGGADVNETCIFLSAPSRHGVSKRQSTGGFGRFAM